MRHWNAFVVLFILAAQPQRALAQCEFYPDLPFFGCEATDGLEDSPDSISPPLLGTAYECSDRVFVSGFARGALLRVYRIVPPSMTPSIWASHTGSNPWGEGVVGSTPLVTGDLLYVTQQLGGGAESDPSNRIEVAAVPMELPPPFIDPYPVYECSSAIGVSGVIPGSFVEAYHDEIAPALMNYQTPAPRPREITNDIPEYTQLLPSNAAWAQYSICGKTSPVSSPSVPFRQLPPDWYAGIGPPPTLEGPAYAGQEYVRVLDTYFGAAITIDADSSAGGSGVNWWGRNEDVRPIQVAPLTEGESITATASFCEHTSTPSGTVPVLPCDELPPPLIRVPHAGQDYIELVEYVPGARIFVFASNGMGGYDEIGDSWPGEYDTLRLTRPIYPGEDIRVTQQVGTCTSSQALFFTAPCMHRDTIPLVGDSYGSFEFGEEDYSLGDVSISGINVPIEGRVYFPTDEAGETEITPAGGRRPVVLLMHGNFLPFSCTPEAILCSVEPHQCDNDAATCFRTLDAACSGDVINLGAERHFYQGFAHIGGPLARAGFIVVSIDANDICSGGVNNVAERRDLFRAHLAALRDNPPGHLVDRLDLERVVVGGHSRGGEASVLLLNDVGVSGVNVLGAIPIAASNMRNDVGSSALPIAGIVGTRDNDTGSEIQAIYDRSETAAWRSLLYVQGANHNWWNSVSSRDEASLGGGTGPLTAVQQRAVLRDFVLGAALRLVGETRTPWRGMLEGDSEFDGYETGALFGSADDLAWHRFSGNSNDIGGTFTTSGFDDVQFAECKVAATPEPESFFGQSAGAWLDWSTPGAVVSESMGGFDEAAYRWLSVRFSQVAEPESTAAQAPRSFEMFTVDDDMARRAVPLEASYSQTPPVYDFSYYLRQFESVSQWAAVRVPLACIIGPDAVPNGDSLRALEIEFTSSEGWVVLDDLVLQQ